MPYKDPKDPRRTVWLMRYLRRPETHRKRQNNELLREYGITIEDKEAMFERQKGLCAICCRPLPSIFLAHVDHCHQTGRVRGLLHKQCNSLIAYFERNPKLLIVVSDYLGVAQGK